MWGSFGGALDRHRTVPWGSYLGESCLAYRSLALSAPHQDRPPAGGCAKLTLSSARPILAAEAAQHALPTD
jgi:hypothetical protein